MTKLISASLVRQHEEMQRRVEEAAPKPITVKRHPEGEEPLMLDNGVVVMPGHFYSESEGIAINPDDVGEHGGWQEA